MFYTLTSTNCLDWHTAIIPNFEWNIQSIFPGYEIKTILNKFRNVQLSIIYQIPSEKLYSRKYSVYQSYVNMFCMQMTNDVISVENFLYEWHISKWKRNIHLKCQICDVFLIMCLGYPKLSYRIILFCYATYYITLV